MLKHINIEKLQNLKGEKWIHGGFVTVNKNRTQRLSRIQYNSHHYNVIYANNICIQTYLW